MIVGVGCDITKIKRFEKKHELLAKKILTENEYQIYESFKLLERKLSFLAGRFAAKEAIIKAVNHQLLLSDIEVLPDSDGKPICNITGYNIHISISHEKKCAIAYAICEK